MALLADQQNWASDNLIWSLLLGGIGLGILFGLGRSPKPDHEDADREASAQSGAGRTTGRADPALRERSGRRGSADKEGATMRLTWRDGVAALFAVVVGLITLAVTQGWGWPLLGSYRAGIVALALVGVPMCLIGGYAFWDSPPSATHA